jgi:hypothetical protein
MVATSQKEHPFNLAPLATNKKKKYKNTFYEGQTQKELVYEVVGNENLCNIYICAQNTGGHDSKVRHGSCSNQAHMHACREEARPTLTWYETYILKDSYN